MHSVFDNVIMIKVQIDDNMLFLRLIYTVECLMAYLMTSYILLVLL